MKQLNEYLQRTVGSIITEAVRSRDIQKAMQLIANHLKKSKINVLPEIRPISVGNQRKLGVVYWTANNEAACFIWDLGMASQIEEVLFTKDFNAMNVAWSLGEDFVWDLEIQAKGANTIQMMLLAEKILTGKVAMTVAAAYKEIEDAQIFEDGDMEGEPINEATDDAELLKMRKRRTNLNTMINYRKKKGQDYADLQAELDDLRAKIAERAVNVRANVSSSLSTDQEIDEYEERFEEEMRATPEERFGDMERYVALVINGVKPLALICGAPGVGKTYRITKALERAGKEKNRDYILLKGKSTANFLFQALHDYKHEGQLVVMDDCDNVFRDDDSINILKAAYDSSDVRTVNWNTARKIPMTQEEAEMCDDAEFDQSTGKWYYPREFEYYGNGIIVTNFRPGQVDTAVKNRALICDLDFTPEETISYIESISDKIAADTYSPAQKARSIEILRDCVKKKLPCELSIRSFTLICGIISGGGTENDKMRMIREQMRHLAARGGKKH